MDKMFETIFGANPKELEAKAIPEPDYFAFMKACIKRFAPALGVDALSWSKTLREKSMGKVYKITVTREEVHNG